MFEVWKFLPLLKTESSSSLKIASIFLKAAAWAEALTNSTAILCSSPEGLLLSARYVLTRSEYTASPTNAKTEGLKSLILSILNLLYIIEFNIINAYGITLFDTAFFKSFYNARRAKHALKILKRFVIIRVNIVHNI